MEKNYVFFDLDGVISDPKEGITRSIDYALRKFGITTDNVDEYSRFIGPPLYSSLQKAYHFDDAEAENAVKYYREYFREKGIFENYMYSGIDILMKHLYDSGKKLVLATSKPTEFSRDIIERYGILDCFYDVCGSTLDNSRTDKDAVIAYAMEKNHITDPADIIMVGDRKYDIIGARKNGIDCIAVTYGYGSLEEIRKSHPTYTVHSVEELDKLFSDSKF